MMLDAGADIMVVQAALRHAKIEVTMRYARVRPQHLQRAVNRIKF
jgi:site-specific recombinase XerD